MPNNDFRTLLGVAFDKNQAKTELDRQIKSLQKNSKLALNIEVSDKQAKKIIQDQSKMWSNYRKEAVAAISAPNTELQKMGQYYKNLEKQSDSYLKRNINGIDLEIKKRAEQSAIFSNQIKAQMQERISAENKIQSELKQTAKVNQDSYKLDEGKLQSFNKISSYLSNNSKLTKQQVSSLKELQSALNNVSDKSGLDQIKTKFRTITSEAEKMGTVGNTAFDKLKKNSLQFMSYLGSATLVMSAIRGFKEVVDNVKEIDSSMISLKKVTNETDATYEKFLTNTAQKAKELGASISDLVESTADFARLGYNLPDAAKLSEVATLYKNVGDGISIGDATQSIISTMKAFNLEAESSITIIDKFNQVGNSFAISSSGIGTALQKSASALASANNTLDESIALITAGNNVIQDPDSVGTALKTLSLRIRGTSVDIEAMGEDADGAAETVSKLRDTLLALTKNKVDIQIDEDTYASTYDIMLKMSKVWKDMTDLEQASALELMFGKRQANIGASILTNMTDAENALTTSLESSGSALREQEKYTEGIQYSIDRLSASMQEMSTTTLDSSTIKWFVDFANGAVNATNAVGGLIPVLTTAGIVYGITKIAMDALLVSTEKKTVSNLAATVSEYGLATSIKATGAAMKSFLLTNPVGWAILAAGAVFSLTKIYDVFNTSLKEQLEIIDNSKKKYEDSTTELGSLNTELQTTKDRINELNALPSLTFTEQSELETLQKTNDELERSIELKKIQQNIDLQSSVTDISNGYDKYSQKYGDMSSYKANTGTINDYINQAKTDETTASSWASGDDLNDYISEKEKQITSWNGNLNNLKSEYLDYASKLEDWIKQFETLGVDNLTTSQKGVYDSLKSDLDNIYENVLSSTEYKKIVLEPKFDIAFNNTSFSKAKAQLEELAKSGKLTPDVISSNKEYAKLLSNTGLSAQEVANQINALVVASDEITESTTNAEEATKAFNDALTALSSSDKAFTNLKAEVKEFGAISMGTINSLMKDYPQLTDVLSDYLTEVATTEDVVNALSGVYKTDMQNWQNLLINKYENNEEFLKQVGGNNSDLINQMLSDYGIDLSNNKTYLEDKMDILNKYLGTAGGAWLKYYDIASGQTQNLSGLSAGEQYYVSKQATLANQALATFNQGLDFSGIESNFKTSNAEFKTDKTKDKPDKTEKVELPEIYVSERADLEHRKKLGLSDKKYFKELTDLEEDYLIGHKEYQAEIWSIDEALYDYNIQGQKNLIKSKFDSIDHDYAMGDIKTEAEYQKQKLDYAIKYYKGNADYQEEWKQAQEEYYKWVTEKDKETAQAKIDNMTSAQDAIIDSFKNAISDTADSASDMTGNEQYNKYSDAIKIASNEAEYLTDEMTKLNKMYKSGSIDEDTYTERLKTLKDALDEAKDSIDNVQDSMAEAFSDNYNNVLDDLSDSYEKFTDKINDSYDAYEKLINAQKESLKAQKDANDYADDITDKTKDIAEIQSDMTTLKVAADTGDRDAIDKLKDLQDELAKEQKELTDTQEDHKLEVEENLLDTSLDNYKTITDKQLSDAETVYNTKLENLKSLYAEEEKLISHASEYTQTEFASKMTALNNQIQGILSSINNATNGSVSGVSSSVTTGIVDTQKGIASDSSNNSGLSDSTKNSILQILKNGTGKDYGNEASALNSYVRDKYGSAISNAQAVKIASLLKVGGISSTDDIKGNDSAKQKILDALLAAKFSTGGIAKSIGEDGVAFVKRDELILNQGGTKIFTQDMIPLMKNFVNSFKLATPNLQNVITKSSSGNNVTVNMESLLSGVTISADYDILTAVKDNASKITEIIAKELR